MSKPMPEVEERERERVSARIQKAGLLHSLLAQREHLSGFIFRALWNLRGNRWISFDQESFRLSRGPDVFCSLPTSGLKHCQLFRVCQPNN